MNDHLAVTPSSGSVFEDLGLPNSRDEETKLDLAVAINKAISKKKLRQVDVAKRIDATQPQVSSIANYKLSGFSIDRLFDFLTALSCDVEIVCRPSQQERGRVRVRQVA